MDEIELVPASAVSLTADTLEAADSLRTEIKRLGDESLANHKLRSLSERFEALGGRKRWVAASRVAAELSISPAPPIPPSPPNLIRGTAKADVLTGTSLDDDIRGLGGNDTILALGGDDIVYGGAGDDLVVAGSGNDKVYGGAGADLVFGGEGNDRIIGNDGIDVLSGEAGNDIVSGGRGKDRLFGDAGDDKVFGGKGADILSGGDGNDKLYGQAGKDRLFGGAGDDFIHGGKGHDDLNGNDGDDELRGGRGRDRMFGGAGNDVAYGGAGNDVAYGGAGNDRFIGSADNDMLYGGANHDTADYSALTGQITYRADVEVVLNNPQQPFGGGFTRQLRYQVSKPDNGVDTLSSIEKIIAPQGQVNTIDFSDTDRYVRTPILNGTSLVGAPAVQANLAQKKLAVGGRHYEVVNFKNVIGSTGNDILVGDAQDNVLTHGPKKSNFDFTALADQDTLMGGDGNDTLVSNGSDRLTGGSGADKFLLTTTGFARVFRGGASTVVAGASTITDFDQAEGDQLLVDSRPFIGGSIGFFNPQNLQNGVLPSEQFAVLGDTPPPDSAIFTYDSGTGDLFFKGFNINPSPGLQTYKVATFVGAPSLQASDIVVL